MIKVRNWESYQHYRDRNPPWIKLHRNLLDNREWSELSDRSAKVLIGLWLIAAQGSNDGSLGEDINTLAWRLRREEDEVRDIVQELIDVGFLEVTEGVDKPKKPWPSRYISKTTRAEVWDRGGGVCASCESDESVEFDHIVPVSKGGTSDADNLRLLCRPCNRRKRVRSTRYGVRSLEAERETEERESSVLPLRYRTDADAS